MASLATLLLSDLLGEFSTILLPVLIEIFGLLRIGKFFNSVSKFSNDKFPFSKM